MALIPPVPTDRLRGAFLAMVKAVLPQVLFFGQYEARVVTSSAPSAVQSQLGGLTWVVSAAFTDAAIAKLLPPLANITMWPGPVWGYSQPAPGSLVRIGFVNGDPSKPAIVGLDPSTPPVAVSIGAPIGAPPLAGPLVLSAPLVSLLTTAGAAAALAVVPGDGGAGAFAAYTSALTAPAAAVAISTKIVNGA